MNKFLHQDLFLKNWIDFIVFIVTFGRFLVNVTNVNLTVTFSFQCFETGSGCDCDKKGVPKNVEVTVWCLSKSVVSTLQKTNKTMENPPCLWYLPGKMGVFHGYVTKYRRVRVFVVSVSPNGIAFVFPEVLRASFATKSHGAFCCFLKKHANVKNTFWIYAWHLKSCGFCSSEM